MVGSVPRGAVGGGVRDVRGGALRRGGVLLPLDAEEAHQHGSSSRRLRRQPPLRPLPFQAARDRIPLLAPERRGLLTALTDA